MLYITAHSSGNRPVRTASQQPFDHENDTELAVCQLNPFIVCWQTALFVAIAKKKSLIRLADCVKMIELEEVNIRHCQRGEEEFCGCFLGERSQEDEDKNKLYISRRRSILKGMSMARES